MSGSFEVKESGLYQLAFHAIQNYNNGLPVYRRIMIDGEVPFREMEAVRFQYDRKWQTYTLGRGEDEPYLFYLEKGSHTLSMAAVQGDSAEIIRQINQDSQKLSSAILQITMLTGQNPDPNYDYQVETRIPGLMDTLNGLADSLELCMEQIAQISGGRPSLYSQLNMAKEQINDLIRDPYSIPVKIGDLNNLLSTYGTAISTLSAQPLMLDRIFLVPADQEVPVIRSSFWARLWGGILNFFNSFTKDYDSVGLSGGGEVTHTLDVWVARGKDWGALIQELADSDFTPAHGVGINIHIVPAGQLNSGSANTLLLAISSGMAPDIGLGVDVNSVGEFAIRNAVVDVSRFEDYDEVMTRFNPKFSIPLTYRGRVYGLPETQNFKVLFYRKDILSELGIGIPETWTNLYNHVLPVLNQNNMQFYYAVDSDPFVYQLGGRYYNDDYTESALDSAETYQGLKEMFELYTVYGVPVSANFFNRFRTGEIPMGIGNFSNYMQIRSAAPEIAGRWGIAVMPGHLREDGTVNHSQGAAVAEAAMIMSQTEYPEDAWEFLKWWMSDDIQKQFGNEIEAQNGETARWNTANTAAFESMPWPQEDLRVIREALSQCDQTEVVLGGYFSTRHVVNAYNRTCISGTMNTRESIEAAVKDINKELLRKRQSAGLDEKEDTES